MSQEKMELSSDVTLFHSKGREWFRLSVTMIILRVCGASVQLMVLIGNETFIVWEWNGRTMPRKSKFLSRA